MEAPGGAFDFPLYHYAVLRQSVLFPSFTLFFTSFSSLRISSSTQSLPRALPSSITQQPYASTLPFPQGASKASIIYDSLATTPASRSRLQGRLSQSLLFTVSEGTSKALLSFGINLLFFMRFNDGNSLTHLRLAYKPLVVLGLRGIHH